MPIREEDMRIWESICTQIEKAAAQCWGSVSLYICLVPWGHRAMPVFCTLDQVFLGVFFPCVPLANSACSCSLGVLTTTILPLVSGADFFALNWIPLHMGLKRWFVCSHWTLKYSSNFQPTPYPEVSISLSNCLALLTRPNLPCKRLLVKSVLKSLLW